VSPQNDIARYSVPPDLEPTSRVKETGAAVTKRQDDESERAQHSSDAVQKSLG
jgi:hypothetical protein